MSRYPSAEEVQRRLAVLLVEQQAERQERERVRRDKAATTASARLKPRKSRSRRKRKPKAPRHGRPLTDETRAAISRAMLDQRIRTTDPVALHAVTNARHARRLSQRDLARLAGVSLTTVQNIEHNRPTGSAVVAKVRAVLPEAFTDA